MVTKVGDYSYYGRGGFERSNTDTVHAKVKELVSSHTPKMMKHLGADGDPATAVKYYSMAADMKSPQATFNLAFMYHLGIGVEVTNPRA
jgi:hypothetical protein